MEGIIGISAGNQHVLALDEDGYVWTWGKNSYGQLGNGRTSDSSTPVRVKVNSSTYLTDIIYIDTGFEHSLAIDSQGNIWVWGRNTQGQLGLDDIDDRTYADMLIR